MYITHYYPKNSPLFARITQCSEEERKRVAKQLSSMPGSALNRFKNFEYYYQRRIQTEKWLYEASKAIHITPNEKSPWYFVLGDNILMNKGFGSDARAFKIDLDLIETSDISFTIGDSIAVYFSPQIEKVLYDKSTILNYYCNEHSTIKNVYKYLQPQHQYIEAQLWTDKYF